MTRGVVYVAIGEEYLSEAETSATSLKRHNDISTAVFTDSATESACFDRVITVEGAEAGFAAKIEYMRQSPFDRTLYLDTDTWITDDISDLFSLLDGFEIAAKHKSGFYPTGPLDYPDVPKSFPEYNTGIIAFRSTPSVTKFFRAWHEEYSRYVDHGGNDQPGFRKALFDSDLRVSTLKEEFHCRFVYPGCITRRAKIFHGRPHQAGAQDFDEIADRINYTDHPRVFIPTNDGLRVFDRTTDFNVTHSDLYFLTLSRHARIALWNLFRHSGKRVLNAVKSLRSG
jgi:hypothetical protein